MDIDSSIHNRREPRHEEEMSGSNTPLPLAEQFVTEIPDHTEFAAKVIFESLKAFQGCGDSKHRKAAREHNETLRREQQPHNDLSVTCRNDQDMDVLQHQEWIRNFHDIPSHLRDLKKLRTLYEGATRDGDVDSAKHVCLHLEDERSTSVGSTTEYDIDSLMGYATSLAFATKGIKWNSVPPNMLNIQTPLHHIRREGNENALEMWRTNHFCFGSLVNDPDVKVYLAFPHLEKTYGRTNYLTDDHFRRWNDEILYPILRDVLPVSEYQYLPSSWKQAKEEAQAKHQKHQTEGAAGHQPKQQTLTYPIKPCYLDRIWRGILTKVSESGYEDFYGVEVFFDAKNKKMQQKAHSLPSCLNAFDNYLADTIDTTYVDSDDFYIDIAKDISPATQDPATTYVWKKCCLTSEMHRIFGSGPRGGIAVNYQFYNIALLRDACNLTCTPKQSDRLRAGGLRYLQFYAPFKNVFSSGKVWPFSSRAFEELALDRTLRDALNAAGKRHRPIKNLQAGYTADKRWVHVSSKDNKQTSFGVRYEYRVSKPLLSAIQRLAGRQVHAARAEENQVQAAQAEDDQVQAAQAEENQVPAAQAEENQVHAAQAEENQSQGLWNNRILRPSYIFSIPSDRWFSFIRGNANKFAFAFELVSSYYRDGGPSLPATKLLAMLIQCLRVSVHGVDLSKETALWTVERKVYSEGKDRTRKGLGLKYTMPRFGYGWITGKLVSWDTLRFDKSCEQDIYFNTTSITTAFRKRGKLVEAVQTSSNRLFECERWLEAHGSSEAARKMIRELIVHLCMQEFRKDLLEDLRKKDVVQDDIDPNEFVFTRDSLMAILSAAPKLVAKVKRQKKSQSGGFDCPIELFNHIWGDVDDEFKGAPGYKDTRQHFRRKQFRSRWKTARDIIGRDATRFGKDPNKARSDLQDDLYLALAEHQYIYPAPRQSSKSLLFIEDGVCLFWSLKKGVAKPPKFLSNGNIFPWRFGRDDWERDTPKQYSQWLKLPSEDFEYLLEERKRKEAMKHQGQ